MKDNTRPLLAFVLAMAALLIVGFVAVGCGGVDCKDPAHASDPGCVASGTVSDCTGGSIAGALAKYGPQVEQDIANAPRDADGSVNWDAIAGQIETDVASAGMCVISEIFAKYVFQQATGSAATGSGTTTPSMASAKIVKPDDAKKEFDRIRAKHAPTTKFVTSKGTL